MYIVIPGLTGNLGKNLLPMTHLNLRLDPRFREDDKGEVCSIFSVHTFSQISSVFALRTVVNQVQDDKNTIQRPLSIGVLKLC